jgi:hypothetical protein
MDEMDFMDDMDIKKRFPVWFVSISSTKPIPSIAWSV